MSGRTGGAPTAARAADGGAPGLSIGRLTLHVPWMAERDAEQLAVLIGEALRAHRRGSTATGQLDRVSVDLPAQQSMTGPDLAGAVARAVLDAVLKELS
ncbi:hypothetical protein ACFWBC_04915 [Streptomyces sp. NPDC059985]|uniref:hypothetical protein n=1 Tax=Streptomyces sp. NPDC059985 TaxID=3347025 RepID=UPI0036B2B1B7